MYYIILIFIEKYLEGFLVKSVEVFLEESLKKGPKPYLQG